MPTLVALIKDLHLLQVKREKEAILRSCKATSRVQQESNYEVSFICDFLCVSEGTKSTRPQVLAGSRHADEGRELAEDEGERLINSACRRREKK